MASNTNTETWEISGEFDNMDEADEWMFWEDDAYMHDIEELAVAFAYNGNMRAYWWDMGIVESANTVIPADIVGLDEEHYRLRDNFKNNAGRILSAL
jgi:hypothetical protein